MREAGLAFRFGHWFPSSSLHGAIEVVLRPTHTCLPLSWNNLIGFGDSLSFKEVRRPKMVLMWGHVWESLFWGLFRSMGFIS